MQVVDLKAGDVAPDGSSLVACFMTLVVTFSHHVLTPRACFEVCKLQVLFEKTNKTKKNPKVLIFDSLFVFLLTAACRTKR